VGGEAGIGDQGGDDLGEEGLLLSIAEGAARSNASCARGTGSSQSITRAPIAASTLRSSVCAQTAPKRLVLARS
jgi:hypothetical protein